jgi:tetratricopeptide (TPR) repeat protein
VLIYDFQIINNNFAQRFAYRFVMLHPFIFRLSFLLCCAVGLLACTSEAVNRERMVNLEKVALKSEITLSDLNLALKQDRGNAVLFAKRALVYLERGQTGKALADINRALELNEEKGEYYFRKALILRQAGSITDAEAAAAEAENRGYKETHLYVLQAELLIRLKQYAAALEKANYALEEAPGHDYALFYRGVARAASRDTASALINFRMAIKSAPAFVDPYLHLASIYNARRDYVPARHYLAAAESLAPDNAFLWLQKGIRYNGLRQTDSAFYCLNKAVALNKDLYLAHYYLGLLHYKRTNYPAVVSHLEKVAAVTDTLAKVAEYLGEGYEKTGRYREALHQYYKVLQQQPNDVRAGWGVRRSNWALFKIRRDSLKEVNRRPAALLDSI